jgi:Arc/MetJ family transcription regulator
MEQMPKTVAFGKGLLFTKLCEFGRPCFKWHCSLLVLSLRYSRLHTHLLYDNVYAKLEMLMKRTNIVLDEKLVEECFKATGIKTQRALIDYALRELLRHESQTKILELKGKVHWEGNLNEWRSGRDT